MTTFDDREKGFERKFANDQEVEFRAQSRGAKLLGEWAARKMGLDQVDDYARAVVRSELSPGGADHLLHKVMQDLAASGVEMREGEVRTKLDEFLAVAREQVKAE